MHKAKDRDVLHISWLLECERQRARVPLRPRYYLHMSRASLTVRAAGQLLAGLPGSAANLPAGTASEFASRLCLPPVSFTVHRYGLPCCRDPRTLTRMATPTSQVCSGAALAALGLTDAVGKRIPACYAST